MNAEHINDVNRLADARDMAGAWRIVDKALEADPNDPHGLILASFLCEKEEIGRASCRERVSSPV